MVTPLMKKTVPLHCLLTVIGSMGFALPIHAQPVRDGEPERGERRPYVEFKIDPNFDAILKERLQTDKELAPLKQLIKKMLADPSKFDPAQLKEFKLDDPKFKAAMQDWAKSDPQLQKALREWLKQNPPGKQPAYVKKLHEELQKIANQTPPKVDPLTQPDPKNGAPPQPIKPKEDLLAKATERAMEQAKTNKWLRDSPALKQAFKDLKTLMDQPQAPDWASGEWISKLLSTDAKAWQAAEDLLGRLREMPRPNLDALNLDRALPVIGELPAPNIVVPEVPDGADSAPQSLRTVATWVLFALLCLVVGWKMLRWSKQSGAPTNAVTNIGDWPVRPEAVSTRTELVQAFDYLALLTLGLTVQSWNHHAVARRWRDEAPSCAATAQALAVLYEQARYTDGADALPDAERERARRSLLQLMEGL